MKRSTVWLTCAVLSVLFLSWVAVWQGRQLRALNADLAYQTERWAECESELESYRD